MREQGGQSSWMTSPARQGTSSLTISRTGSTTRGASRRAPDMRGMTAQAGRPQAEPLDLRAVRRRPGAGAG
jgi:hypothetical protein